MVYFKSKKALVNTYKDSDGLIRCHWCNKILKVSQVTKEHILPQWCGGPHWKTNLFISCIECQQSHRNPLDIENHPTRQQAIEVVNKYLKPYLKINHLSLIPKDKHKIVIEAFNKRRRRIISCLRKFPVG